MARMNMDGRRRLLFLTTSSGDTTPYIILVALIKGFQNHVGLLPSEQVVSIEQR